MVELLLHPLGSSVKALSCIRSGAGIEGRVEDVRLFYEILHLGFESKKTKNPDSFQLKKPS